MNSSFFRFLSGCVVSVLFYPFHALAQTFQADTNKVNKLMQLAASTAESDMDKSLDYAGQAYRLSEKREWKKGIALTGRFIAGTLIDMGKYDTGLVVLNKAYITSEALGDKEGMAINIYNRAVVHQLSNHFAEALDDVFAGIRYAEEIQNKPLIAKGQSIAAYIYVQQNEFEKGIQNFKNAARIFAKMGNTPQQIECLDMIGFSYAQEKKLDMAWPYFKKAIELCEKTGDELAKARIFTHLVSFYEYKNDPVKRLEYLNKSQAIWDRIAPNTVYAVANMANLGVLYSDLLHKPEVRKRMPDSLRLKDAQLRQLAESYLLQAMARCKKIENPDMLAQIAAAYSEFCEYQKSYSDALKYYKQATSIKDSLYSQESKNKIASIESQREIERRDKDIALHKLQNKQLWLYGIIVIALIIGIFGYFLNRYRIRQWRLKNQMKQKESERKHAELNFQKKVAESELKAIRSQMNPHFIFNVLNSIESYILQAEARKASKLIQRFAVLSRLILENSMNSLVSIEREWTALKLYTELECIRFDNEFSYTFEVDSGVQITKGLIPPMMVQPLIENAILHGLRNSREPDRQLHVKLELDGHQLRFIVQDNGIGIDHHKKKQRFPTVKRQSFGLQSVRERISVWNAESGKPAASLCITDLFEVGGQGTLAILTLPLLQAEELEEPGNRQNGISLLT